MSGSRKRRLGAGVDMLLSGKPALVPVAAAEESGLVQVPLDRLQPSPHQPRSRFDPESIAQLARSLKTHGLIQPIVVRRVGERMDLVAGERRVRAAREAGLSSLPAVVRDDLGEREAAELTLVENLQREDLNPIDVARGLQQLTRTMGLSHGEAADRIGRARSTVTNLLRLLELESAVQDLVRDGSLSMGHARLLVSVDAGRQEALAREIIAEDMTVRAAEDYIGRALKRRKGGGGGNRSRRRDADLERLERRLSDHLGHTVSMRPGAKGGGHLLVRYSGPESLQGLLRKFGYSDSDA